MIYQHAPIAFVYNASLSWCLCQENVNNHIFDIYYYRPRDQSADKFLSVCGVKPTYTNWAASEPNDSGGRENCVHFYTGGVKVGQWNDGKCASTIHYICEFNYLRCK